jgi:hypothetical protein
MLRTISASTVARLGLVTAMAISLGACGTTFSGFGGGSSQPAVEDVPVDREMPASIRADAIVGRWGLASYQNPADRARTEKAAQGQCKNPYVIGAGANRRFFIYKSQQDPPHAHAVYG